MKGIYIISILLVFIVIAFYWIVFTGGNELEKYGVSPEGLVSYENRPKPVYEEMTIKDDSDTFMSAVTYESRGQKIYGLLSIPKPANKRPAFVVLPGSTVRKESEQENIAKDLNDLGFATLTLDQRGTGETDGQVNSLEMDYISFKNRVEPIHHRMIHDALVAYDILAGRPEIDNRKIYFAGISMGGRLAIISGAIEKRSQGVLAVATSGYGLPELSEKDQEIFLRSIDPDNYVKLISPRRFLMLHSYSDTVIPFSDANRTFLMAGEPKKFYAVEKSPHAYKREEMKGILETELNGWR